MEIIQQKLVIHDWPLTKVGDERFFGYVMAMGIFPKYWACSAEEWAKYADTAFSDDPYVKYVDFIYGNKYERFQIPNDERLFEQLSGCFFENWDRLEDGGSRGKVWVKLTEQGFVVEQE